MNLKHIFTFLVLAALAHPALGQNPAASGDAPTVSPAASFKMTRMITMRPSDKRPLSIKTEERNPYALRSPESETVTEEENSEEAAIRAKLTSLSVTGRSNGRNGPRLLLGDIIVEQGRILPQLIQGQTESLSVVNLTDDAILLGWRDSETGELTGKSMQISFDLTPSIAYALHGQRASSDLAEGDSPESVEMGVLRIGQDRRKEESRMAARDPARNLPREVYEAGQ